MLRLCFFLLVIGCSSTTFAQQPNLAQRLGYPADARLLIIHADDLGVAHSENQASFAALERGVVNSASVMAPCPWLPEVAAYARAHPEHDFGMHLTLTSEWRDFKWGPVAGQSRVPSLVDSAGYFHADCASMAAKADIRELEIELRAQIERARELGLNPTHLDSHMGCLFWQRPEFFELYLKLGRAYNIPVMVGGIRPGEQPELQKFITAQDILIDNIITASPTDFTAGMAQYYERQLRDLPAGVNIFLIHCAYDNDEMKGVSVDHPHWGAQWRQDDFNFFTSDKCKLILAEENIRLVTWRQIGKLLGKP